MYPHSGSSPSPHHSRSDGKHVSPPKGKAFLSRRFSGSPSPLAPMKGHRERERERERERRDSSSPTRLRHSTHSPHSPLPSLGLSGSSGLLAPLGSTSHEGNSAPAPTSSPLKQSLLSRRHSMLQ
ncbi:hypothetical protein KIPB_012422, partial [Kipferlia bialata]|eukprot:g12422.t1